MNVIFYIAAVVAIIATAMVVTGKNAVHALLYMIVSFLAVSVIFFLLGAPFIAALEIITYAGAIMVLFLFVAMMLNLGEDAVAREKKWLSPGTWIGPGILCLILLVEMAYVFFTVDSSGGNIVVVGPKDVGISLFGPYVLGVELVAMLLMAGIVGAYHIGNKKKKQYHRYLKNAEEDEEEQEKELVV